MIAIFNKIQTLCYGQLSFYQIGKLFAQILGLIHSVFNNRNVILGLIM